MAVQLLIPEFGQRRGSSCVPNLDLSSRYYSQQLVTWRTVQLPVEGIVGVPEENFDGDGDVDISDAFRVAIAFAPLGFVPVTGDAEFASGADFVSSVPRSGSTIDRGQATVSPNLLQVEANKPLPSRFGLRLEGDPVFSLDAVDSFDSAATRSRETKHVDDVFQEEIDWQIGSR